MITNSAFKPAWWMRNRHLQTILPRLYPTPCDFSPFHNILELSDGDFVELTWSQRPESIADDKPIVLVLHGLEGSFDSFYAKRMMNAMYKKGWATVLMHFRGCGKRTNRKAQTYHSGQTADVVEFIARLKADFPTHPLYAVGFSLGGNVLTKYVGENEDSGLDGAVVISAPLDLAICSKAIGEGFAKVYQKYLVDKLRVSTKEKIDHLKDEFPINVSKQQLDDVVVLGEFDELVTAPLNGFKDAQDYYQQCSGNNFLKTCNTPTLIIHAKDDPFMTSEVIPTPEMLSEQVTLEVSEKGGHVGFLSGMNPFNPEFWAETRSTDFISQCLDNLNDHSH